jgi:hypothetical protein
MQYAVTVTAKRYALLFGLAYRGLQAVVLAQ